MKETDSIATGRTPIQHYFEKRVPCYAEAYSRAPSRGIRNAVYRLGWFPLRVIFRHTRAYLAGAKLPRVLDVGCGCGIYSVELAGLGAAVTALDTCEGMVAATEGLAARSGLSGSVHAVCADYLDWSAGMGHEYDLILAIGLFDYVSEASAYLASFGRLARDVIITFPAKSAFSFLAEASYRHHGIRGFFYTRREIEDLLLAAGFETVRFSKLFPGTFWVHARRGGFSAATISL